MILAGDVGGTNARFCIYSSDGKTALRHAALPSKDFDGLEKAAEKFLSEGDERIEAACIGVAGPVVAQRCEATNLPWIVDARKLASYLGVARLELVNDLVAHALGALTLPPEKLAPLVGPGRAASPSGVPTVAPAVGGNLAILAAGTGLGEAALVWDGARYVPLGTEGGHTDFAPRGSVEAELLDYLRAKIRGRVSYERVLSGPGIGNLYDFFVERGQAHESPEVAAKIAAAKDRNVAISDAGLDGTSAPAKAALDLFVSIYGAEAGNLALKTLATGGVYVGGGIAKRLLPLLRSGTFEAAFTDKGRMSGLVRRIPVTVVLDSDVALAGTARHAAELLLR